MTVHAVRVVCAPRQADSPPSVPSPAPPDFDAGLLRERMEQNVLADFAPVLDGQQTPFVHDDGSDSGITAHIISFYRFDGSHGKTAVLDAVENGTVIDAAWYLIRYHDCDHDASPPDECPDWTDSRSRGAVPGDV